MAAKITFKDGCLVIPVAFIRQVEHRSSLGRQTTRINDLEFDDKGAVWMKIRKAMERP